ncbi:MAG TPA: hypothetical protein VII06_29925 [Chloroflexota bacterium]|jgi:hypothetical protein
MADDDLAPDAPAVSLARAAPPEVTPEDYRAGFGEDLQRTLDLSTWSVGEDLSDVYRRVEEEIAAAVAQEGDLQAAIRKRVFPQLAGYDGAPKGAGVYQASPAALERVHRGLLFNGGVEGCDGTQQTHDTLPLTIAQVGVSLVSYQGNQGTWGQRLFRRDLRVGSGALAEDMQALLERRDAHAGQNQPGRRDRLSDLMRRGIMTYAERAILAERSTAPWRLGHGSPAPYELITGAGLRDFMVESTKVVRALVEDHQKFVFVASEPSDRLLLTIGQALRPLEYAIVRPYTSQIYTMIEYGEYYGTASVDTTWDGVKLTPAEWIKKFRDVVGPQVVVGVYRATHAAPAQVFYAHRDHADVAAHVVLADSLLQWHRGFPLLLDLAHHVCSGVFGGDTLAGPVATAYADAGAPWRYASERMSRAL